MRYPLCRTINQCAFQLQLSVVKRLEVLSLSRPELIPTKGIFLSALEVTYIFRLEQIWWKHNGARHHEESFAIKFGLLLLINIGLQKLVMSNV